MKEIIYKLMYNDFGESVFLRKKMFKIFSNKFYIYEKLYNMCKIYG